MVDFWQGMGNLLNSGDWNKSAPTPYNPPGADAKIAQDPLSYGSADVTQGSPAYVGGGTSPTPSPASSSSLGYRPSPEALNNQYADNQSTTGGGASGGIPNSLSQTLVDQFLRAGQTPAMDPQYLQSVANQIGGLQSPDYLAATKQGYQNVLNQISGVQNNVNNQYDQVKQLMSDIYGRNVNAATLGNNNVLQSIASNQGAAIQGNAKMATDQLANLKNAQLAERMMLAQKAGGGPDAATAAMTYGTNQKIDPQEVAAQGLIANAQQAANNANAGAADRTQLNNDMAMAMQNQGGIMQQQLANQKVGYNAEMGKYLADLANQESQREVSAMGQNYQTQLNKIMAGYGIDKDLATMNIEKDKALYGSRGMLQALADVGSYDQSQARALQYASQAGLGGLSPYQAAANSATDPNLAAAYAAAISKGSGVPGTKMDISDIVNQMMQNNPSFTNAQALDFAQRAGASKPMASGLLNMDDLLSSIQGSGS